MCQIFLLLLINVAVRALTFPWGPNHLVFDEKYYVPQAVGLAYRQQGESVGEAAFRLFDGTSGFALPEDSAAHLIDLHNTFQHPPFGKWVLGLGSLFVGDPANMSGWRLSSVIASVFLAVGVALLTHLLLPHARFAPFVAGLLITVDGQFITMGRIGMLDIFVSLFATFGTLFLVLLIRAIQSYVYFSSSGVFDSSRSSKSVSSVSSVSSASSASSASSVSTLEPSSAGVVGSVWRSARSWALVWVFVVASAAGVFFGLAVAVKWNSAVWVAVAVLVLAFLSVYSRRLLFLLAALVLGLVSVVTYVFTWFLSPVGYGLGFSDRLVEIFDYHVFVAGFMMTADSGGEASVSSTPFPLSWIVQASDWGYVDCSGSSCVTLVNSGNPVIWVGVWVSVVALASLIAFRRLSPVLWVPVLMFAAGVVPWIFGLRYPWIFYTSHILPFGVVCLTACLVYVSGFRFGKVLSAFFVVLSLVLSLLLFPHWNLLG